MYFLFTVFPLPVCYPKDIRGKCIKFIQDIFPIRKEVCFNGTHYWINDPVFFYPGFFMQFFFISFIIFGSTWRQNLHDQVRCAVDTIFFNDIPIPDDHYVWNYAVIIREVDISSIPRCRAQRLSQRKRLMN